MSRGCNNTEQIKVSIIIPVYDVEKYLDKCLSSCVRQTLPEIEVIVVNDASPDGSDEIMKRYAANYPDKVVLIFLQENLRQGGARNEALKRARGKYICCVDGDDYIDETMCEKMYHKCEKERLDMVCCNGYDVIERETLYVEKAKKYDIFSKESLWHFCGPCFMLVRRELIITNGFYFPEHIFFEDCAIVPLWYLKADRMSVMDDDLYYYVRHSDSCGTRINFENTMNYFDSMEYLLYHAQRSGLYKDFKKQIDGFILGLFVNVIRRMAQFHGDISLTQVAQFCEKTKSWKHRSLDETFALRYISRKEYEQVILMLHHPIDYIKQDFDCVQEMILAAGYPDMWGKINHLLVAIQKEKGNIVVWGSGYKALLFMSTLKHMGVSYIVGDNKETLWNQEIRTGDVVRNIDWIKENVRNPVFLIATAKFYMDIAEGLKRKIEMPKTIDLFSYIEYDSYQSA